MGQSLTEKIIESHLVAGTWHPGRQIAIRIDQTLTQDATGTMAYLQFEAMGIPRPATDLSVSYIDHNTIQIGFENADDHRYLHDVARKYGIRLSRAGNGICHQVHLERFGVPGTTLLGSDSHTPTAGGLGMLAIGTGGLDVALAMAGRPFYLACPRVIEIKLIGALSPWVTAKDVILHVLRHFTTRGNVGSVFEYTGDGVTTLSVPERATITNMGAECGVTTSIFPSDGTTRRFLTSQGRGGDWKELTADRDALYDGLFSIDLTTLEPLVATPHSPENVVELKNISGLPVDQVCIGSCTNGSFHDLAMAASILKGRVIHEDVSLIVAPGSRQVLENLARDGYLADLIAAGARIDECACGFCIGNSCSPPSRGVSLRTSNRNFRGRSGTADADVYLVSPVSAAAAAVTGVITDPRTLGIEFPRVPLPDTFHVDDGMILFHHEPPGEPVEIRRGGNIGQPPVNQPFPEEISGEVLIKVGDRVTTDHIMPAGELMKYRSNIERYAEFVFKPIDPSFPERARHLKARGGQGIIVAGLSYGQGSSREHAAMCPMHLGVKAVIALSFERIHAANLINFGILPILFSTNDDYEAVQTGDTLHIPHIRARIASSGTLTIHNRTRGTTFQGILDLSERDKEILPAGGALNLVRKQDVSKDEKHR
ncbi:MAG: aconitate hydratase [Syntrophales bacterium]|jgi:aconitate hydratase|nr:aconitate hydratase [Syntrophales bacterium]MCK9527353.1 aconitate hydratase [Syntrophales bacterium]MDX9921177.1 aconitate hydratase [Syntrophales bacterium]